jgi:hypothetical protein
MRQPTEPLLQVPRFLCHQRPSRPETERGRSVHLLWRLHHRQQEIDRHPERGTEHYPSLSSAASFAHHIPMSMSWPTHQHHVAGRCRLVQPRVYRMYHEA